jgi:hypothetical protein
VPPPTQPIVRIESGPPPHRRITDAKALCRSAPRRDPLAGTAAAFSLALSTADRSRRMNVLHAWLLLIFLLVVAAVVVGMWSDK